MKSPLGDRPVTNNAGRGKSAPSPTPRVLERMASPAQSSPSTKAVEICMNDGGKGTAGRKTYPNLGA